MLFYITIRKWIPPWQSSLQSECFAGGMESGSWFLVSRSSIHKRTVRIILKIHALCSQQPCHEVQCNGCGTVHEFNVKWKYVSKKFIFHYAHFIKSEPVMNIVIRLHMQHVQRASDFLKQAQQRILFYQRAVWVSQIHGIC